MPTRPDSSLTMFVYLNGHHLLEYYFAVSDSTLSANDSRLDAHSGAMVASPADLVLETSGWD